MANISKIANILKTEAEDIKPTTGKNAYAEQGISGLVHHGWFVHDEFLEELKGIRGTKVYREMKDNDSTIGGIAYAVESILRQVGHKVEPAGNTDTDKLAAEFLESCLVDMEYSFSDTLSDAYSFLWFGFCIMELNYKQRKGKNKKKDRLSSKYNDGRVGWSNWGIRSQETVLGWIWDEDNRVVAMRQLAPPDYKERIIPADKYLNFRPKINKDNPEGRSLLRNCYRDWFFKKNIQEIEAIGIEKDLNGVPIIKVPAEILAAGADPGNSPTELVALYNSYVKMISNFRRNEQEFIMLPSDTDEQGRDLYDVSLISSKSSRRQFDTDVIIKRYNKDISMSLMADFLMLGNNSQGSFALSKDKTSMFKTSLNTIIQTVYDEINTKAIPRLFELNSFEGMTDLPKLIHNNVDEATLTELSNYLQRLTAANAIDVDGDTRLEDDLRERAGITPRPGKENTPDIELDLGNKGILDGGE